MRAGFVLDWKIWMGCLQSSVILHIHTQQIVTHFHTQKQIKKQRRLERICVSRYCVCALLGLCARVWFDLYFLWDAPKFLNCPERVPHGCTSQNTFNPRKALFEHVARVISVSTVINNDKDDSSVDFWGCSTLPWDRQAPRRLQFWFRPPHPQTCPHDARVPHWACPSFVAADEKGGGLMWG